VASRSVTVPLWIIAVSAVLQVTALTVALLALADAGW
jgi:hypothetical protein